MLRCNYCASNAWPHILNPKPTPLSALQIVTMVPLLPAIGALIRRIWTLNLPRAELIEMPYTRQLAHPLIWIYLVFSPYAAAYDAPGEFGLVVQAASDWIYDGTTETRGEPSIGINGEWRPQSVIFLGFEAHQAKVAARTKQQGERSVAIYAGADHTFGKTWYTDLSLQHRAFPGAAIVWNFTEVALQLAYRDNWSLKLDYSPDYYKRNTTAFGTELAYTDNISSHSYWSLQVGMQELSEPQFIDYHYARFGVGISAALLNLDLSYGWNSEDESIRFGNQLIASPKFVLQLNYRLK